MRNQRAVIVIKECMHLMEFVFYAAILVNKAYDTNGKTASKALTNANTSIDQLT